MANPNAGEYRSVMGLDSLYIAQVTEDDAAGYVAGTPQYLAPAAAATQEPATANQIQWADNQSYDVLSAQGETKITLTLTGIPAQMVSLITGATYDAATGRVFDNANQALAPYFALLFRAQKSNGAHRYYCYLKGKFMPYKEEAVTKSEKPDPKPNVVEFMAIKTIHLFTLSGGVTDSLKRVWGDEDTDAFIATSWFSQVQVPGTTTPSALALSSSDPADNAASVAITKVIVLTFNNALANGATSGVVVAKADGTPVTSAKSLDTTKKIMTVTPSGNLSNGATYIVAIGVSDVYAQTLNTAINFATVA